MDTFNELMQLSPPVILAVALNFVGLALKKSPVADWLIPWLLILIGGAVFPFIAETGKINYECKNPFILHAIFGMAIGGLAIGLNQGIKQLLRNRQENAALGAESGPTIGGTSLLKKKDVEPPAGS